MPGSARAVSMPVDENLSPLAPNTTRLIAQQQQLPTPKNPFEQFQKVLVAGASAMNNPVTQQVLQQGLGFIPSKQNIETLGHIFSDPLEKGTKPYYVAQSIDVQAKMPQQERVLREQLQALDKRLSAGRYPPGLNDTQRKAFLDERIAAGGEAPLTDTEYQTLSTTRQAIMQAFGRMAYTEQGLLKTPREAAPLRRASPAEIEQWEAVTPMGTQMLAGVAFDPWNWSDLVIGPVSEAVQAAHAAQKFVPVLTTGDDLLRIAAQDAQRTKQIWTKLNIFEPTYSSQLNKLRMETYDNSLGLLSELIDDPLRTQKLGQFVEESEELAKATSGTTWSAPYRRTAAIWRKSLAMEEGTQPYTKLIEIMSRAKSDNEAVVQILKMLDNGIKQVIPAVTSKNPLAKLRDGFANLTSKAILGYNWRFVVGNTIGDTVPALVDGNLSLMRTSAKIKYAKRYGTLPIEAKQGVSMAGLDWNNAADVNKWLSNLTDITRVRNVFKDVHPITRGVLDLNQNVERLFSDHITISALMKYHDATWTPMVKQARNALIERGIPKDAAELLARKWSTVVNKQEIWDAVNAMAADGDLSTHLPGYVRNALNDAEPGLGTQFATIIEKVPAEQRDDALTLLQNVTRSSEETAARSARLKNAVDSAHSSAKRAIKTGDTSLFVKGMGEYFSTVQKLVGEDVVRTAQRVADIKNARRILPPDVMDEMWEVFRGERRTGMQRLDGQLENIETTLLPTLGFANDDVKLFSDWRAYTHETWQKSDDLLEAAWSQTRSGKLTEEQIDLLWEDTQSQRTELWNEHALKRNEQQYKEDLAFRRAIASNAVSVRKPAAGIKAKMPKTEAEAVPGKVKVGDTIELAGQKYKLKDTPEDRALIDAINGEEYRPPISAVLEPEPLQGAPEMPVEQMGEEAPSSLGRPRTYEKSTLSQPQLISQQPSTRTIHIGSETLTREELRKRFADYILGPDADIDFIKEMPNATHGYKYVDATLADNTTFSVLVDEVTPRIESGETIEQIGKEYQHKFATAINQDIADLETIKIGAGKTASELPPNMNIYSLAFRAVDPDLVAARGSTFLSSVIDDLRGVGSRPVAKLTAEQLRIVSEYTEKKVIPDLFKTKAIAKSRAVAARHFALGNYASRRNIDEVLKTFFPWSYWYRFSYWNWTKRFLQHPGILSNYMRFQDLNEKENLKWYHQMTGDPNATMPPELEGLIRLRLFGRDQWFDVGAAINPMRALTKEFSTRARRTAPLPWAKDVPEEQRTLLQRGELLEKLNEYGPALYPEIIWAYSAWLKANGYDQAAEEFSSYLWSGTPIIKAGTALIREKFPETAGVIPPGGVNIEGWANPFVKGGDTWERRKVGFFLMTLLKAGEITETQFQNAAQAKSGPIWDRAVQMGAITRAPGKLLSYFTSIGMRPYGVDDVQEDLMWNDYYAVWDQYNQISYDDWRELMDEFDAKYPWAMTYMLARETDPVQATSDYTRLVDQRMPPGNQRVQIYKDAGIWDLVQKFYDTGTSNPLSKFTDEEYQKFKAGIEKVGANVQVPSTAQTDAWAQVKQAHSWMLDQAYGLLQQQGYWVMPWDLEEQQDAYFASDNPDQYLEDHPTLQAWWNAQTAIQNLNPAVKALEQKYFDTPESVAKSNFWDAVPPGFNWQKNTEVPAVVKMMLDEETRDSMTNDQIAEATAWLKENVPAQYADTKEWAQARTENDQYEAERLRLFGSDLVELNRKYGAMTAEERELFQISNPEQFNRLKALWDFKKTWAAGHPVWDRYYGYGASDQTDGSSSYPITAEAQKAYDDNTAFKTEATQRFGSDILDLARTYAALDDATRAQFRVDRAADYQRLKAYWDYKREYGTTHPEWQRYYGFPDTGTTYSGGGGYSGGYRSWGGYGGGGATPTTPTQPVTPTPATPAAWESWSSVQFDDNIKPFILADSSWQTLVSATFGPNIWNILSQWFSLTAEQRAAWKEAHPDLWALIQKFMTWFLKQKPGAASSKRVLESIPKSAPIVPPEVAKAETTANA